MYIVKTLNQISPAGLRAFDPDRFVLDDGAERPDALLCRSALQRGFLRQRGKRESSPSKKDKETGGFLVRNKIL